MRFLILAFFLIAGCTSRFSKDELSVSEASAFADKLIEKKILLASDKELMLKRLKSGGISVSSESMINSGTNYDSSISHATILKFCAYPSDSAEEIVVEDVELEEVAQPGVPIKSNGFIYEVFRAAKASAEWKKAAKMVSDLQEIGLITPLVYADCMEYLKTYNNTYKPRLLDLAANRTHYYNQYENNKADQIQYLEKLVKLKLLTEDKRREIIASYKPYELKTPFEIFKQTVRCRQVSMAGISNDSIKMVSAVLDAIRVMHPDFRYNNLQVFATRELVARRRGDSMNLNISYQIGNDLYSCKYPRNFGPREQSSFFVGKEFNDMVDRHFRNRNSDYRFFVEGLGPYGRTIDIAYVCVVSKDDTSKVSVGDFTLKWAFDFDNRLAKNNINTLIESLRERGFLAMNSESEIREGKRKAMEADNVGLTDILTHFPNRVLLLPYRVVQTDSLMKMINAASQGKINIKNPYSERNEKNRNIYFGFTMNGRKIFDDVDFSQGLWHRQWIDLVNRGLKDEQVDGQYYRCPRNIDHFAYIFLTDKQAEFYNSFVPILD